MFRCCRSLMDDARLSRGHRWLHWISIDSLCPKSAITMPFKGGTGETEVGVSLCCLNLFGVFASSLSHCQYTSSKPEFVLMPNSWNDNERANKSSNQ